MPLPLLSRLAVSTRLLAGSLAFALPLAVLGFFMDLSFRYDLNICRSELAGSAYLRAAYTASEALAGFELARSRQRAGERGATPALEEARGRAEAAMAGLGRAQAEYGDGLGLAREDLAGELASLHPDAILALWTQVVSTPAASADKLLRDMAGLIRRAADHSMLSLDPALDSASLVQSLVMALPQAMLRLLELESYAAGAKAHEMMNTMKSERRDRLARTAALLREGFLHRVLDSARAALREDPNYYGISPTLAPRLEPALEDFDTASGMLLVELERVAGGASPTAALGPAAQAAREAGATLRSVGLDELDALIRLRAASYTLWRRMALGLSGLAILAAAFLMYSAGRSVAADVRCLAAYARSVAKGDYAADCRQVSGGEFSQLAGDLRSMVDQLKQRLAFAQGLLNNLTLPCLVVDREERLTFVNQAYFDLYARPGQPKDALGLKLGEFFYQDPDHPTITGQAMREDRAFRNLEIESPNLAGRLVSVRYDVAPLRDLDGQILGAFALIVDLTELKAQQREIARLAAFTSQSPNPVLSAAPDGTLTYHNPAAAREVQESQANLEAILPEQHRELVTACLATGQSRLDVERASPVQVLSWTYHPLPDQSAVYIYGVDITLRKHAEQQLLYDAFHDGLTNLPNKTLFLDRVGQVARAVADSVDAAFAVCLLDLDRFKQVNDSLGHALGDRLLLGLAGRLCALLRPGDTLARFSGDEFGLLLDPIADPGEALALTQAIHADLARAVVVDGHELSLTASIGVAVGFGGEDPQEMVRDADNAMYRAKAQGGGRSTLFDPAMHFEAAERLQLEILLKKGVEAREFLPHFQPLVDLDSGAVIGFEALARWRRADGKLIPPGRFIPLAEETGLIVPLGEQILALSCAAARQLSLGRPQLTVAVNLAVRQMTEPDIVDTVARILRESGLPPARLKLEVTESGIMGNVAEALDTLGRLKGQGLALAIDDFGTGYSSLSHLHRFPFDFLKVDQSFVGRMVDSAENAAIVRTIIDLAHSLGKQVIAEGVETPAQLAALRRLGCEIGQGYLFAKPMPLDEALEMLGKEPRW